MATVTIALSPQRLEALAIVARAVPHLGMPTGQQNMVRPGIVGWQQAHWLVSQYLATRDVYGRLHLTARGRIVCGYAGIPTAEPVGSGG